MAFTSSVEFKVCVGDVWMVGGVWDGTAVTTGELSSELKYVYTCVLGSTGNGVQANDPSVDETLPGPVDGAGNITIDFDSGATGSWIAVGRV